MNLPRLSLGVCPTPEQVGSDGAVTPRLGGMRWGKTVCPRVSMVCVPPCIRGLPRVGGVYLAGPDGHGCGGLCGGDGPKPGGGWDGMNLPRLNVGVCPTPEQVGSDGAVTPKGGGCVVGTVCPRAPMVRISPFLLRRSIRSMYFEQSRSSDKRHALWPRVLPH